MTTWICPFCEVSMNVKPSVVGSTRKCVSCAMESIVTDSEQEPEEPTPGKHRRPGPSRSTLAAASAATAEYIAKDILISAMLAQIVLVAALLISALSLGGGLFAGNPNAIQIGFAGILAVIIAWPIYTIANETYRSRRLLEELLKRRD